MSKKNKVDSTNEAEIAVKMPDNKKPKAKPKLKYTVDDVELDDTAGDKKSKSTANDTKSKNAKKLKIVPEKDTKDHRKRVRAKVLKNGFSSLADYELLEFLLFHSIVRKDTKDLSKCLLKDFGSLSGVIDAKEADLREYAGVGDSTITLFMAIKEFMNRYHTEKINHKSGDVFDNGEKFGEYFKNRLYGYSDEVVFAMFLDNSHKMISCDLLFVGDMSSVNVNSKTVIELALKHKASSIALAHNHPHGNSTPSEGDVRATKALKSDLKIINVKLVEHIIVTPTDYLAMSKGSYI